MLALRKLFSRSSSDISAVPVVQPTAKVIPFPNARVPDRPLEKSPQAEYDKLAKSLKFAPEELVRMQILALLKDHNIPVFDYAEVNRYMTDKKEAAGKEHWFWRPLRDKDGLEDSEWGYENFEYSEGYYRQENDECRSYDRLVPLHALQKVALLERRFRNRVSFFVSDYGDPKPDPFLGVMSRRVGDMGIEEQMLIIDVWHEPGFGKK